MKHPRKPITILIADDDADDRMLIEEAFVESRLANERHYVADGEELLDFLRRRGPYAAPAQAPRPGLLLLDLNMPKKDGREVIKELKSDPHWRSLPIVVLTTSKAEEDILRSYDLGANSFITKPVKFEAMIEVVKALSKYWFEIVTLSPITPGG